MASYKEVEAEYIVGKVYDWDILSDDPDHVWVNGKLYLVSRCRPHELVCYRLNDRNASKTPTFINRQYEVKYAIWKYANSGRLA